MISCSSMSNQIYTRQAHTPEVHVTYRCIILRVVMWHDSTLCVLKREKCCEWIGSDLVQPPAETVELDMSCPLEPPREHSTHPAQYSTSPSLTRHTSCLLLRYTAQGLVNMHRSEVHTHHVWVQRSAGTIVFYSVFTVRCIPTEAMESTWTGNKLRRDTCRWPWGAK